MGYRNKQRGPDLCTGARHRLAAFSNSADAQALPSATTTSKMGTRMALADPANRRRQRPLLSDGAASVICGPAGIVILVLANVLVLKIFGAMGISLESLCPFRLSFVAAYKNAILSDSRCNPHAIVLV